MSLRDSEHATVADTGRLHRIVHHASEYARLRFDLLKVDVRHERDRLAGVALRWTLVTMSLSIATQLLLTIVIALSWNTRWRLPLMFALMALLLLFAASQYHALRALRRESAADAGAGATPASAAAVGEERPS